MRLPKGSGVSPVRSTPLIADEVCMELAAAIPGESSIFKTIPPERVGLRGEYDHAGLAKRVSLALHQNLLSEEIGNVKVAQRGRVVVFSGKVSTHQVLHRMVAIALRVYGATDVETLAVSVGDVSSDPMEPCSMRYHSYAF